MVEHDYGGMTYEDRALVDRKLIGAITGRYVQMERVAIGCLTRLRGLGQADGAKTREWLADALDTVDKMLSAVRQSKPEVTTLADHLDVVKGEAMPGLVKLKADILWLVRRNQPHLTKEEILACYIDTPAGQVPVFNGSDQPSF